MPDDTDGLPPTAAPWTARIWEHMADGQWHHRDDLVALVAGSVPPGRSYRTHLRGREQRPDEAMHTLVAKGQRTTVLSNLRGLVRTGRLEKRPSSDGRFELRRSDVGP